MKKQITSRVRFMRGASLTALSVATMVGTAPYAFAAGNISNTATVNGTVGGSPVYTSGSEPSDSVDVPIEDKAAAMQLYKTVTSVTDTDSSGTQNVGDTVNYSFTITNTGNVTLTDIAIVDALPASITYGAADGDTDNDIDTLAPGASVTVTGTYNITQTDIDAGYVENTAVATGKDPQNVDVTDISDAGDDATETPDAGANTDGDPTNDPTVLTLTPESSLSLTKAGVLNDGGDGVANAGDTITYTMVVTNTGATTLSDIAVTDSGVDAGSIIYGAEDGDTDNDIDSLAPGATATVTATYTLTQTDIEAGSYTNQATATGSDPLGGPVTDNSDDPNNGTDNDDNGDGEPDDQTTTTLPASPALTIDKVADTAGPVGVGDIITYTYTVTNTGNVIVNDIALTDVHNGSTLVSTSATSTTDGPFNEAIDTGTNSTDAAVNGSWDALYPNESITFTFVYTVTQADVDAQN